MPLLLGDFTPLEEKQGEQTEYSKDDQKDKAFFPGLIPRKEKGVDSFHDII